MQTNQGIGMHVDVRDPEDKPILSAVSGRRAAHSRMGAGRAERRTRWGRTFDCSGVVAAAIGRAVCAISVVFACW